MFNVVDIKNKRKSVQINQIICEEENTMSSKQSGLYLLSSKNHRNSVYTKMPRLSLYFRKIIEGLRLDRGK